MNEYTIDQMNAQVIKKKIFIFFVGFFAQKSGCVFIIRQLIV